MSTITQTAKEFSLIVPRWMRLMRTGFLLPSTMTAPQFAVLMAIYEQGWTTTGKLSEVMGVSAPTITGIVDRLARVNYVTRIHDEQDRRVIHIRLTKKAEAEVHELLIGLRKRWESILALLRPQEGETLLELLKKILNVVEARHA